MIGLIKCSFFFLSRPPNFNEKFFEEYTGGMIFMLVMLAMLEMLEMFETF